MGADGDADPDADGDADPDGAVAPDGFVAVCGVVLKVAATPTPLASRVTVTGSVRPKFWQLRLVKDMLSRFAMKVNRLLPTAGTGDWPVASTA